MLSFKQVLEDQGNPFLENDLIHIVSKTVMSQSAIESVETVLLTGQQQYEKYKCERLVQGKVSVFATISQNKLPLFRAKNFVTVSK